MTEACHVSKHQRGRPAGTTGWWGIKCIWHNRFLWWCHDRTSSTDLVSLHRDSTLFEEHRPCFLVAFLGALILKIPPWLVHIQQCRNTVTWLVTIPLDVTRSSSKCIWFIKYTAFIVVPLQRRVPVRCLYHYSQEHLVVYFLATAKGVHTSGGKL